MDVVRRAQRQADRFLRALPETGECDDPHPGVEAAHRLQRWCGAADGGPAAARLVLLDTGRLTDDDLDEDWRPREISVPIAPDRVAALAAQLDNRLARQLVDAYIAREDGRWLPGACVQVIAPGRRCWLADRGW